MKMFRFCFFYCGFGFFSLNCFFQDTAPADTPGAQERDETQDRDGAGQKLREDKTEPTATPLAVDFRSDLFAGQSIYAGSVDAQIDNQDILITAHAGDAMRFESAHLFVGRDAADIPVNAAGSPQVGRFPVSEQFSEFPVSASFRISLSSLLGEGEVLTSLCNREVFIAAHFGVSSGSGGHHSAWAEGPYLFSGGSWATYSSFIVNCSDPEPTCRDALVDGSRKITDFVPEFPDGWVTTIYRREYYARSIFLLDPGYPDSKGAYVGEFYYSFNGTTFIGEYILAEPYTLLQTSLYADNMAPSYESFAGKVESHRLDRAFFDRYDLNASGYPLYVTAHAVVCTP